MHYLELSRERSTLDSQSSSRALQKIYPIDIIRVYSREAFGNADQFICFKKLIFIFVKN